MVEALLADGHSRRRPVTPPRPHTQDSHPHTATSRSPPPAREPHRNPAGSPDPAARNEGHSGAAYMSYTQRSQGSPARPENAGSSSTRAPGPARVSFAEAGTAAAAATSAQLYRATAADTIRHHGHQTSPSLPPPPLVAGAISPTRWPAGRPASRSPTRAAEPTGVGAMPLPCARCGLDTRRSTGVCRFHPGLLPDAGPLAYGPEWHACRAAGHTLDTPGGRFMGKRVQQRSAIVTIEKLWSMYETLSPCSPDY